MTTGIFLFSVRLMACWISGGYSERKESHLELMGFSSLASNYAFFLADLSYSSWQYSYRISILKKK